jgi:hypothetical protein
MRLLLWLLPYSTCCYDTGSPGYWLIGFKLVPVCFGATAVVVTIQYLLVMIPVSARGERSRRPQVGDYISRLVS